MKKPILREDCLKKGAWTVCRFKGELDKKGGTVFEGELIPKCTPWYAV